MSNCSKENYHKLIVKNSFIKKIVAAIIIIAVIFVCFFVFLIKKANPIILSYGESEVSKLLSISCNEAIAESLNKFSYESLINIGYDNDNNISYMVANTHKINQIGHEITTKVQSLIEQRTSVGLKIPLGTLTGIGIFAGKGSLVNFTIFPKGNVLCNFNSKFESSGINQTSHKIFITIQASCYLILPFKTRVITKSADFLIAECVIIGKIPNTYLSLNNTK